MRLVWIILVGLLGWAAPQTGELPRWVLDLSRIKRHLRANFEHMPNFVCLETIQRSQSARRNSPFRALGVLRLEVAVVGGRELYAPEGAGLLKRMDLTALISQGAIGDGDFSGTPFNLFVHDGGRTTGFEEEFDGGKKLLRYDYEIPQMQHPRTMSAGSRSAVVGERGSFWVDPETLDLVEIEENATDIPPGLGIMEATTNIRYGRVRIGKTDALLPSTATLVISNFDGSVSRNVMEFSGCREYVSESTISFGPAYVSDSKVTYGGEIQGKPAAPPAKKK